MERRFRLFRRGQIFYAQDNQTGKQESLRTSDREQARQLLKARNEAARSPHWGLAMAKAYLSVSDPLMTQRVWAEVMSAFQSKGRESTRTRRERAFRNKSFDLIRDKKLVETTSADFLNLLNSANASTHHYLRLIHSLALGMGWLLGPVLPGKLWPRHAPSPKRAITWEEHCRITGAEKNLERRLFYEVLWEIGASQSDAARLIGANIDWNSNTLSYVRKKTGEFASIRIGQRLASILEQLPRSGPLFLLLEQKPEVWRSAEFSRRCRICKITGVSLHSYRYSWAERARACGYPERWAQSALGHNSRAIHHAYAKRAIATCPSLEQFEQNLAQTSSTAFGADGK